MCEVLNPSDSSVRVAQLPSTVECEVSQDASLQPSAERAHCVPSPNMATDTQLGAPTQGHVVSEQPLPLCTRAGRPIKLPARLICEMNEQIVDDSVSTSGSVFSIMRDIFFG